jgi:hypothetical protein
MKTKTREQTTSIRTRGQLSALAGGLGFTLITFAAVVAQLPSGPPPSPRQLMKDELAEIAQQRRARIAELQATAPGERCHPPSAHELARLLVMDGQGPAARRFADAYEQRCGDDPVVRKWGDAPRPRHRP